MEILLIIISILLIAIVILQSNKAESASSAILGGNDELFAHRKERGSGRQHPGVRRPVSERDALPGVGSGGPGRHHRRGLRRQHLQ